MPEKKWPKAIILDEEGRFKDPQMRRLERDMDGELRLDKVRLILNRHYRIIVDGERIEGRLREITKEGLKLAVVQDEKGNILPYNSGFTSRRKMVFFNVSFKDIKLIENF